MKRFNVLFSITQTAASLWDYGEDALTQCALEMSEAGLRAVQRIAATYEDPTYPLPTEGQRITHNHVNAIAAVANLEAVCDRWRALAAGPRRTARNVSRPANLILDSTGTETDAPLISSHVKCTPTGPSCEPLY